MSTSFSNLVIEKVILHQIYERNENREVVEPRYSQNLTLLDAGGLQVLQDRIINAMGNNSHCIEMDISNVDSYHTFQLLAKAIYKNDGDFIDVSKQISKKLAESQTTRSIPGGIVVVFKGKMGIPRKNIIGVIKAEIHEGFLLDSSNNITLSLKYLSDLLLTPQQKLYKIGLFVELNTNGNSIHDRLPNDFKVFVYDNNVTKTETASAALYFYNSFLGCTMSPTNKKITKSFYYETKNFIDTMDVDDEIKIDLNHALYSYLKTSQETTIKIESFANEYLTPEIKDDYCRHMSEKGIPTHAIIKDIDLINSKLKLRKIRFTSNVSISAPADKFKDIIEIVGYDNNKTTIRIEGRVEAQQ